MTMSADQGIGQAIAAGGRDQSPNRPVHVPGAGLSSAAHISAPVWVATRRSRRSRRRPGTTIR